MPGREFAARLSVLVVRLGSSDRKPHCSGGDAASAFEVCEALVSVFAVAVGDVVCEGVSEGVPVGVVGVFDDELADRQEVALDPVELAGVGRVATSSMLLASANLRMSGVQLADRLSWIQ
jgi:hypothetical protein